jgi:hypothetical protein
MISGEYMGWFGKKKNRINPNSIQKYELIINILPI